MSFSGYLALGGRELVNHARFDTYMKKLLPGFQFRDPDDIGDLAKAIEGYEFTDYTSPLVDDAPWLDPSNPATQRFYGAYVTTFAGARDSTRSATVTESLFDGGSVGSVRKGTKQFAASLLLVAADQEAMDAGLTWLDGVLDPDGCGGTCGGDPLCFFIDTPRESYVFDESVDPGLGDSGALYRNLTSATTPVYGFIPVISGYAMCMQWEWKPTYADSVQVQWGTANPQDPGIVQQHDPVYLQRTNQIPNPTFSHGSTAWWSSGFNTTPHDAGGPDGGAYGAIADDEEPAGVSSSTISQAPQGRVFSVRLRSAMPLTVRVIDDETSDVLGETTTTGSGEWELASVGVPAFFNTDIIIIDPAESGASSFDMAQALLESGSQVLPYFDGDSASAAEFSTVWRGTPGNAPSRRTFTGSFTGQEIIYPGVKPPRPFFTVLQGTLPQLEAPWGAYGPAWDQWVDRVSRTVFDVTCTSGPTLNRELNGENADCGVARIYDIVLTAGKPWQFTPEVYVPHGPLGDPVVIDDATIVCPVDTSAPIQDPDCPVVPSAPRPPVVDLVCSDEDTTVWDRYFIPIPAGNVSANAVTVPILELTSLDDALRSVRVRAFPNPFEYDPEVIDPCSWCAEFILSYLPPNTVLTMDGRTKSATAAVAGASEVPATNLLYGSDDGPMTWPELTCGTPYVLTVDVPQGTPPTFQVVLDLSRRE